MLSDKLLDSIDIFGAPAQSLNFEGRHRIHTWLGVACSLVLFTGISLFAAIKVNHVFTRHNPKISRHAIDGQFKTPEQVIDLEKENFFTEKIHFWKYILEIQVFFGKFLEKVRIFQFFPNIFQIFSEFGKFLENFWKFFGKFGKFWKKMEHFGKIIYFLVGEF